MNFQSSASLLSCMLVASALGAAPPTVTDMGLLPGDLLVSPATNSQQDIAVAPGGAFTLVAWTDYRGRSSGTQSIQSDGDIFGIRVDASGSPVDSAPFLIAGGMGLQEQPRIAWNGQDWLVVFRSQDPYNGYYRTQIRAVRISPQGVVLDATPILFPPHQFEPDTLGLNVAGQSGQWLVTRCLYHDDGYGTYLAGQRIGSNGQFLDPLPVKLMDWVYGSTKSLVNAGEYLVVGPDWYDSTQTKARRVNLNAQPLGNSFTLPGPTIASNGSEYYVTWVRDYVDMVGSRMTSTGIVLNPAGTLLFSDPSMAYYATSLTHDGLNWWFEWHAASTVRTMRIDPAGNVLDPGGILLPIVIGGTVDNAYGVTLSPVLGGGINALWYDLRPAMGYDTNVYSMDVSPANLPGTERCVSTGTTSERSADFSAGPAADCAVVFVSESANDDRVLVHLIRPSGAPSLTEPIEVYRGPTVGHAGIAWNGACYMITWDQGTSGQNPSQIFARRMDASGHFIDATPFFVMTGFNADVESLSGDFLVAGCRFGTYPQFIDLVGMRIDGSTAALRDGSGIILGLGYVNAQPRVRADGTKWLVAAHSMWTHNSSQGDAILAIVPLTGAHTPAFNPTPFSGGTGDLDISFSGSKYLLVWRMNSLANANNYIAGRIMNADGTFAGGWFTIAEAAGRKLRPTVEWDGTNFIVAWDDQRNQSSFFDARTDVYAARVTESGIVLDTAGFAVDAASQARAGAALLTRPGRATLVASTRFMTATPWDSYRVGLAKIGEDLCAADFDGTGFVDFDDFNAFVGAFELGGPDADFDGTGFVDLDDFAAFVLAFETGC